MNPMQGPRNTGGSSNEVNQADGESIYSTETSLDDTLILVDSEVPHNSTSSGQPTCSSSSSHNWWGFGEFSSLSRPSDQVSSIGIRTSHQLPQDGGHHFVPYGSEGRELGLNGRMVVHGGAHASSHIRNGPSFLPVSSSNTMPQHVNTSGVVISHNNSGSSLGSPVQAAGERSSGTSSSLGVWGSACKRKALEGAPTHSFSGETSNCGVQTGNGASHAGHAQCGTSSCLSLAAPSQVSSNETNHFFQTEQMFASGGERTIATNAFHITRSSDTLSRLGRGRRLNPRQPQESTAFSIPHAGSSARPTGSLQHNLPLNSSSFVNPPDVRSALDIVNFPALTRNIQQFALDASSNSRASDSSGIWMPADPYGPRLEGVRICPDQPLFAPETDTRNPVHDQSVWSLTRENFGSSMDSPFVPRPGPSSVIHTLQPNPTWILPQDATLHYPSRTLEHSPWSFFPSIESQSASHGVSLSLLPTSPSVSSNEGEMPSRSINRSHRSWQRRSGFLSERERRNDILQLRRGLAAANGRRNELITEINEVLNAIRREDNLPIEGMGEYHDRHREMRLDVDNMSYEELLALGERIGEVSTGLREDFILKALKQHQHTSSEFNQDIEPCCICQEEYGEGDDVCTLECGHKFHKDCIKQWIMIKNLCPVCKTVALKT